VKGKAGAGTRFSLLIYQRLYQMWFWPSLLLLVASVALMVLRPWFLSELYLWFLPVAIISAGLMGYSWLARHATYVQAHPHSLRIKSPLFRLVMSYGRIYLVRTTPFKVQYPPETLSWTRRQLAEKLYGRTCLVVEVKGFPLSKRMLAVLLNYFLLTKQVDGFTLLVEDWLQLSNEIEAARATWVNRRVMKREKRAVEKILRD
jgi:hypothetical protein